MKTKTSIVLILILILTLTATACSGFYVPRVVRGDGDVIEESRAIESFDEIDFRGIGNLYITIGEEPSLTIEAEENLLDYLETYNQGDRLVLKIEDGYNINPTEPVNFYLTAVSLEAVSVSGLGNVELPEIEADRFRLDLSGAGDIELESLTAEHLEASLSGLGNLKIDDGQVISQDVSISGSGEYDAPDMESEEANIEISGLGSATVFVTGYLDVSISGAGGVDYYGDPEIDQSISGLGDLDKLDD